MKIRYLAASPKNGTTEHVSQQVGNTLVAAGFAEAILLAPRGSRQWFEDIKEIDAMRTGPSPYDTVPSNPAGTEWGIKAVAKGKVLVLKSVNGQLFYLDSPGKDCPSSIRQQWLDACAANPEANGAALDAAKRAQQAREQVEKVAKWGVLFPSKL